MKFKHLLPLLASVAFVGFCNLASAGTLTYALRFEDDYDTSGSVATIALSAMAWNGSVTTTSYGFAKVDLTYVGSATDTPPATLTWAYSTSATGTVAYSFFGRTPPSGSGSSNYSVTYTPDVGSAQTLADSMGPEYQQTTGSSNSVAQSMTNSAGYPTVSTGTWAQTVSGTTITYTRTLTVLEINGSASADCSLNWKSSNSRASWVHTFDPSTFYIAP